jgi:hypothetical protein
MRTTPAAWLAVALLALGLFAGCADSQAQASDTAGRADQIAAIMRHVRALTQDIGPREQGSAAAGRAADYIAQELERLGSSVERQVVGEQVLPAVAVAPMIIFTERRLYVGDSNLVVRFGRPASAGDKAMLFMAHYDSVHDSPGAVDNAASVAVLLELARNLAHEPPPRPVIIAFTAAEEIRLAGARALVDRIGDEVGLAVSLDLFGAAGTLTLNGLSSLMGKDWLAWLARTADDAGVGVAAPIPHRVVSRLWPQIERSDHGVFTHKGIPAFHLYSRPADALYLPYHTFLDTADRVDAGAVADGARLVEALSRTTGPLPRAGGDPGMWLPVPGRHWIAPAWVIIAIECLLLAWIALVGLGLVRGARSSGKERAWRSAALDLGSVLGSHAIAWMVAYACLGMPSWLTGHPMPWAHDPLRHMILATVVATAASVVLIVLLFRWRAPRGRSCCRSCCRSCYMALALACCAITGAVALALGLHELAWIPLVHGALLAGMAHATRPWSALGLHVLALVPLAGPLHPNILREAVFNGFLTPGIPLALVLGFLLLPAVLGMAFLCSRFVAARISRRAQALVLALALVAMIGAAVVLSLERPVCDARGFTYWNLTCELSELRGE